MSLAYTHIFLDDVPVNLTVAADANNTTRGNLSGSYEGSIDIVAVQARFRF